MDSSLIGKHVENVMNIGFFAKKVLTKTAKMLLWGRLGKLSIRVIFKTFFFYCLN